MWLQNAGLACMIGCIGGLPARAAEPLQQLSSRQIQAKFAAMEFTDETHFADVFERDGQVRSISMGKRNVGRWRASKRQLCIAREHEEERCYEVWMSGVDVQLRDPNSDIVIYGVLQKTAAGR